MSGRAEAIHGRANNSVFLKLKNPVANHTTPSFRFTMITGLVLVVAAYLGQSLITERPTCVKWNHLVSELETNNTPIKTSYESAEKVYRLQAQLSCWHFHYLVPFESRSPETLPFCEKMRYPKDKIPSAWRARSGLPESAIDATTKLQLLEQNEDLLQETISQKPLLCSVKI